jgi:hypothetical protein
VGGLAHGLRAFGRAVAEVVAGLTATGKVGLSVDLVGLLTEEMLVLE